MKPASNAVWLAAALLLSPALAGRATATGEGPATLSELEREAVAAPEPAEEMSLDDEEPMANGHVARAAFTTGVAEREPTDEVTRLGNDATRILFFTDLRDLQGQTVTHVWEHDGKVVARVPFSVKAPRWRVYSSKNLEPSWTGEWAVKVVDATGQVIHAEYFEYVPAADGGSVADAMPEEDAAPLPASMPEADDANVPAAMPEE
jgi:hypothetical protein